MSKPLPKILASTVIRTASKGEAHGGLYVVDLETEERTQVLNWDTTNISFRDRGAERGLRGISFFDGKTYVCSVDKVMIFDQAFSQIGEISNPYFGDLHETYLTGHHLWVTSSGFDSILRIDLQTERCDIGICFRNELDRRVLKGISKLFGVTLSASLKPAEFDPNAPGGPIANDVTHVNTVSGDGARNIFVTAHRSRWCYRLDGKSLIKQFEIPLGTHNVQPFKQGYVYCDTEADQAVHCTDNGRVLATFDSVKFSPSEMKHAELPKDFARPGFVRGLCIYDDKFLVAGTSPASVMVFDIENRSLVKSINLSMDIRNAIHGLEVYPYGKTSRPNP